MQLHRQPAEHEACVLDCLLMLVVDFFPAAHQLKGLAVCFPADIQVYVSALSVAGIAVQRGDSLAFQQHGPDSSGGEPSGDFHGGSVKFSVQHLHLVHVCYDFQQGCAFRSHLLRQCHHPVIYEGHYGLRPGYFEYAFPVRTTVFPERRHVCLPVPQPGIEQRKELPGCRLVYLVASHLFSESLIPRKNKKLFWIYP